jgi:hypothetical protein
MRIPDQLVPINREGARPAKGNGVTASIIKSCGSCFELRWPNGTGTGSCVQDCCTSAPRPVDGRMEWETECEIESCDCPMPGGLDRWPRGSIFF